MKTYFEGIFSSIRDVKAEFSELTNTYRENAEEEATDVDLSNIDWIFAQYNYQDYSGEALVVFQRDGKVYEVGGGHCSCYGLEGQWNPVETALEAVKTYNNPELKKFIEELESESN